MTNQQLAMLTAHEARDLLDKREVSSVELTEASLERIDQVEDRVGAFVTVTREVALEQAKQADQCIARGDAAPLTGVPMQLKDVICTEGIRTTCSSKMLESFVPPYDATVTERLYRAGAVLVGKGNMDEFAMGSSTENSAFFPTHNPWDLNRVPGGSSGGPAASVAAGECFYSLGSDTGGSIRQPGALCGVVGMKPTYGLVSRFGLVAFASSLDQIGPLTRDVRDCATVLNAIAGHDPRDSTSIEYDPPDYTASLQTDLKGLRIGVPKEYFVEGMEPGVEQATRDAITVLEGLGAETGEVSLPSTPYALAVYYIIAPSECSANLARYDGVKYGFSAQEADSMWDALEKTRQEGFGPEVKRRIMLGTYALSAGYYDAFYLKAQRVRTLIRREYEEVFGEFDALVTATSPSVAFELGSKTDDPMQMYLNDVLTLPANIAGIPGISVPAGLSNGLPVGLQILGKHLGEETMLRVAYAFEQATNFRATHGDAPL
ncbi:MAG: Asp-tRNA(Asn)/Glu-tRNA(Gln) amidotransferase subunit GatA [SAR202 cluster bacterium]|jgi:aspartyl-tRNA(Asn)/glutamyl-tRNA(Gln) amidotransferase subunit A|nr:Asp-tRNA(Asn)/Glu-tRNA(Gln) amidotransferase subunit GatA [SAR202 cluster bacterium]MDP7414687.1 Asp-tRNA(Asn)/Glu-tRNA(Gln) amidotransferase subunit GatA [SAR202 cluster bacterium]